jgi:uncharacterized protein
MQTKGTVMPPTPADIMKQLDLKPHPTCGYTNEVYRSALEVPQTDLPAGYDGPRPLGGFLYFLVTTERRVNLHRIRPDQMYHHYTGDPLEVLLLYPDGKSEVRTLGTDLAAGMRPQLLIPGGTFHTARVRAGGSYALLGTSLWLRPEPSDVEIGDVAKLSAAYPAAKEDIGAFTE